MTSAVFDAAVDEVRSDRPARTSFFAAKRLFDLLIASLALLPLAGLALAIAIVNPFGNRGPLIFRQQRMGRDGKPFTIYKFRTMAAATREGPRGPEDPVEAERITPLGRILRRTRLDETPQIINILRGDMSIVGPRPDIYGHALAYCRTVPAYRARLGVRPGLTGYAQITAGYAEGSGMTGRKAALDLHYIERIGFRLDALVLVKTLPVLVSGFGSK